MSDDLINFIQLLIAIFTVVVLPFLTWFSVQAYRMSKSKDKFIKTLASRNDALFMRLDDMENERRLFEKKASDQVGALLKRINKIEDEKDIVEKQASDYRNRVLSLEEDLRVMREQMIEIEAQNRDLKRRIKKLMGGIEILMNQIKKHESRPDWQLPKDDKE